MFLESQFFIASAFAADPGTHRSRLDFVNMTNSPVYVRVLGICRKPGDPGCESQYVTYSNNNQSNFKPLASAKQSFIGDTLTVIAQSSLPPTSVGATMYTECGQIVPDGMWHSQFQLQISTDAKFLTNTMTVSFQGQQPDVDDDGSNNQGSWPDGFNGYWELASPTVFIPSSGITIAAYNDVQYYDKIPNTKLAVVNHTINDNAGVNAITIYSTSGTSLPGGFF